MALVAAILGWLFDGLEMGLFPLVARPALQDLLQTNDDKQVGLWIGIMHAGFLVGAATGGVLFGWLGDRLGRVKAMTLSVLAYTLFTGLCAFAPDVGSLFAARFVASLGMGGEWSLGVSLVMEIWPNRSRAWLAGLIGAASNVGFVLIAVVSLGLSSVVGSLESLLGTLGLPQTWIASLTAHGGWRLLMLTGAVPALLTFFIRLFVPESERWLEEHAKGTTSHWAARDLVGVLVGACGPLGIVWLWAGEFPLPVRIVGTIVGFGVAVAGYLFPVTMFLKRIGTGPVGSPGSRAAAGSSGRPIARMLLGACLSGTALIGTWASIQNGPAWADKLSREQLAALQKDGPVDAAVVSRLTSSRQATQIVSGVGAIFGTIVAALLGDLLGRRTTYVLMCLGSLASAEAFFNLNTEYGTPFVVMAFFAGALTASFYGWLPLYLPELFSTRLRATGQGFAFNFGRILAAVAALQTGVLLKEVFGGDFARACSIMSLVYVAGLVVIWFVPETKGQPLPE
jgi:MFS family permease